MYIQNKEVTSMCVELEKYENITKAKWHLSRAMQSKTRCIYINLNKALKEWLVQIAIAYGYEFQILIARYTLYLLVKTINYLTQLLKQD